MNSEPATRASVAAAAHVLEAQNVSRGFREGNARLEVLSGVELQVARGERLAIIGTSG